MGLAAYPGPSLHRRYIESPPRGRLEPREQLVDLISYWKGTIAPYIRARFAAKSERGASLVEYATPIVPGGNVVVVTVGGDPADPSRTEKVL